MGFHISISVKSSQPPDVICTSQDKKQGAFQDCHCLAVEWKKFVPAKACVQGPILDLHLQEHSGHSFRFHQKKKTRKKKSHKNCIGTISSVQNFGTSHPTPEGVEDAHTQHGGACERLSAGLSGPIQSSQPKTLGLGKKLSWNSFCVAYIRLHKHVYVIRGGYIIYNI